MAPKKYNTVGFTNLQYLSIAGGSLDLALIVSNVQHFKFLITTGKENVPYFYFQIGLLMMSITLQLLVAISMYLVNSTEMTNRSKRRRSNNSSLWQKITLAMVMLIAVLNVFIAVFGERSDNTIFRRLRQMNA